jgi:tryptophan synthase beta chain
LATDDEALRSAAVAAEGIIPALEPACHCEGDGAAPKRAKDHLMVVNLSGRGDKDVLQVGDILKGRRSDHLYRRNLRRTRKQGRLASSPS